MASLDQQSPESGLIRAVGIPGLVANIVNTTIGAGIFVLPALVAVQLGAASPLAFIVCALAMCLFVTSFAIAGSRVSLTGGLYAYVEVAFGRYIGFLAGILFYLTAIVSVSGVVSLFAGSIGALAPPLATKAGHIAVSWLVFGLLALINIHGVRTGARAVATVTIVKLLPLIIFVSAGIFFIQSPALAWPGWPGRQTLGEGVLLLLFAFAGIEVALVPSGEIKAPARTVPRAIFIALAVTTFLYIMIQVVAQGILGADLAKQTDAPLAAAAARFSGSIGRTVLIAGATISAFGFVASDILGSPRLLFAFGRDGILPAWFAHIHPRFRTPDVAILTYAVVAALLSSSATFQQLAILANVAVLLLYLLCCLAAWELSRRGVRGEGEPFSFRGEKIVPLLSCVVIIWILSHAPWREFAWTGAVLGVASTLYIVRRLIEKGRVA